VTRRLLDTNVLSERLRARPDPGVADRLSRVVPAETFASAVTRFELRYGAGIHPHAASLWVRIERDILPLCSWLPLDDASAEAGALVAAELKRAGRPIGVSDCMIAGTALARGLVLVTRNTAHFERVRGLKVENWFGKA